MRSGGRENAVMPREGRAHANDMKEPRTERSQRPRLKIEVDEGLGRFRIVLMEKSGEVIAAKMVNYARGNVNLPGEIGGKRIAVGKRARQGFGASEAVGFIHESGIEIDSGERDIFGGKGSMRGEPANGIADAAAYIHDADWAREAARAHGVNGGAQDPQDAIAMIKLLGKALHFPVDRKHETVNGFGVEKTIGCRHLFDDPDGFVI